MLARAPGAHCDGAGAAGAAQAGGRAGDQPAQTGADPLGAGRRARSAAVAALARVHGWRGRRRRQQPGGPVVGGAAEHSGDARRAPVAWRSWRGCCRGASTPGAAPQAPRRPRAAWWTWGSAGPARPRRRPPSRTASRSCWTLRALQPSSPEWPGLCAYLETLASLPWSRSSGAGRGLGLRAARAALDEDHWGLEAVKRRILEFLAVQRLRGSASGPILCLHGPPGIGKTSLGRSVARALGRPLGRIALGGMQDEAELRGHRRTYTGSAPGAVITALQVAGVNDPVLLLDEVDKLARGGPFNAEPVLLEVLDPEQNCAFRDHYLNVPFDLSRALFLCTANDTSAMDRPLLDRLELLELPGYTAEEKVHVVRRHLLPKLLRLHALAGPAAGSGAASAAAPQEGAARLRLTPEAVDGLIAGWTREGGVRSLERVLARVCRWAALRLHGVEPGAGGAAAEEALAACGPDQSGCLTVDAPHLPLLVGPSWQPAPGCPAVGTAVALGRAAAGALPFRVEAARWGGAGRVTVTGAATGAVAESVAVAVSVVQGWYRPANGESNAPRAVREHASFDGSRDPLGELDVHVHFPNAGLLRDGPSVGLPVALALLSVLLDRPPRADAACAGEVALRGSLLPVDCVRDRVSAAHRAGIQHVVLPRGNRRHVEEDVPSQVLQATQVHYPTSIADAVDWMFLGEQVPRWDDHASSAREEPCGGVVTRIQASRL
ncbi:unnamed protein product [Prorocentrum cordatum]|uniref:AAA+ ATPase domain-containing protein n=1 Tax=Prorocentrum cordatum TaxID=2364126 RepID=A0ABN9T037_9DINO|nr:unnamed protein product [Polarella glacialis]